MRHTLLRFALLPCLLLLSLTPARAHVALDDDDPKFVEIAPADGSVIAARTVTISGRIEDASSVTVRVTGEEMDARSVKTDAEGRFSVSNLPLRQGRNEFTLDATDEHGNDTEVELVLVGKDLVPPVAPTVFEVNPITRLPFLVIEGRAEPEARVVITGAGKPVVTDAAYVTGLFSAIVRPHEGENELNVFALDEAGTSPTVRVRVERRSAQTLRDKEPAQINISSGNAQRGLPRAPFSRPLVALVTDRRGQPVPDVPVDFKVSFGDARFATGERFKGRTDANGRVSAQLNAGESFGLQLVYADFAGNTSSQAAFAVETVEPRADGLTNVSGILLDWYRHPLADVPVRLGTRTARTGRDGRFRLERVTPGPGQRLEVFGDDIKSGEGRWSDASYPIDVLPGVNNDLGRPMFVSPLNEGPPLGAGPPFLLDPEGRVTSEGALLSWHDDYGHAEAPQVALQRGVRVTASRPLDGQKFSATLVGDDRTPVTLDDGLATSLYLFVGPRGVEFDRPLPIKLPNLNKLAPGSPVMIMRYDASAGLWVREGHARVHADGRLIESDEGSGLRRGGWYAFAGERTYAEYTRVNYLQIEGKPEFEGKSITHVEVYSRGKTALMMSRWGEYEFKRLHFRVTLPAFGDDMVVEDEEMEHRDSSRKVEVIVTPSGHAMEPGEMVILTAAGRPHPGGYYVWTSSDPSVASVEPVMSDGSEHPNRARVFAHRLGRAKITALYITNDGATSAFTVEVTCHAPPPPNR